jgi:hypothetical protein
MMTCPIPRLESGNSTASSVIRTAILVPRTHLSWHIFLFSAIPAPGAGFGEETAPERSFFCPAWREGRDFQFAGKTAQKLDAVSQGKLNRLFAPLEARFANDDMAAFACLPLAKYRRLFIGAFAANVARLD